MTTFLFSLSYIKKVDVLFLLFCFKTIMSSNESISCSFCEQRFSSSREMSEHLISCGNKTDQCPNCNKFIRRAIFAYHYENNCASLDDSEDNTRSNNNTGNKKVR